MKRNSTATFVAAFYFAFLTGISILVHSGDPSLWTWIFGVGFVLILGKALWARIQGD